MTSRSILGGSEQSIGFHYGHGTQPDSYYPVTYASSAFELAPSLVPQAVKVLPSVARSALQDDRASISEAVLNIVVPLGAALVAVGTGVSFGVSIAYWFF